MKYFKIIIFIIVWLFIISNNCNYCFANQEKDMDKTKKTIRLVYPQWQGGNIASIVPELNSEDASKGYILGAYLLNYLAPKTNNKIITIPVSNDIKRVEKNGIIDYQEILEQTKNALSMINEESPDKILTLGGECSVSVVPFTYLASKYKNDIAMIWIDAHPDITLPCDKTYNGYHAMAVTAIMGEGDKGIISHLPAKIDKSNILFVGLRDWERKEIKERQLQYNIKHLSCEDVSNNSSKVLDWIKSKNVKHVVIHFDLDVLDPQEIIAAVGVVPKGMKIDEVVRIINDIQKEYDIVGLTIAEPMPKVAIKLKNMLEKLPLVK